MGFFDKARSTFTDRFGDETVRKGSFGARDEEESQEVTESKGTRPSLLRRQPKSKPTSEETQQDQSGDSRDGFEFNGAEGESFGFPEPEPQLIDREQLSNLAGDEGQSVGDILKSLGIAETFTIDEGVLFLDEELANQEFATQAPYGYDMGEVDFFLAKAQRSVAEYVRLLRRRNDDVVKLAGRISDMLVELNNLRFNSEVANGINIMASGGDEDGIAFDLQEERARNKRLEEEIENLRLQGTDTVQSHDPDELESLRNDLAAERRAKSVAESEAADLRAHLVLIEEEYDIQVFSDRGDLQEPASTGYDSYNEQRDGQFQQVADIDSRPEEELFAEEAGYQRVGRDHWLPGMEEEDETLPTIPDEEESLPDEDFAFEEGLLEPSFENFEGDSGGFSQGGEGSFEDSAFTANPYQNLDEFIEENSQVFPEDPRSEESSFDTVASDDEDPDEDGFQYSFERRL